MPQTNRLRYTTYANPRVRRDSAGFLVAETDLDNGLPPICATLQVSTPQYTSHVGNNLEMELNVYRENNYEGLLVIQIGVFVGKEFKAFYSTGAVDWEGKRFINVEVGDTGYFDVPMELHYRVDPVDRGFSFLEDKLTATNSEVASLTVQKGLIQGAVLTRINNLFSVNIQSGLLSPNDIYPPQFGGNGGQITTYVVGEFYSADSLAFDKPKSGHAYLRLKTNYSEKCGGVGLRFPPVVALLPMNAEITYENLRSAIYLSLSDETPKSYGEYSYDIPDAYLSRGKVTAVVMDDVPSKSGELISTEVLEIGIEVREGPFVENYKEVKKVVIDCTSVPLTANTSLVLKVSVPTSAAPFVKKTYYINSNVPRISFPVWSKYTGDFSYSLEDDRGRIIDRRVGRVEVEGTTSVLVDPSNYLYSTMSFYLISDARVKTVQENNPWSKQFTVSIAEKNRTAFYPYEIGLQVESKPDGTEVSVIQDSTNTNKYIVTVRNPTDKPLPNSKQSIVLRPYRMSGIKRADIELFVEKTIPCEIVVATAPPIPVFTPVPPSIELAEIVKGIWTETSIVGITQIVRDGVNWNAWVLSASEKPKIGFLDNKMYAVGLTVLPNKLDVVSNEYRIDYKFTNGINTNVDYYIRSNYSVMPNDGTLLSPDTVPYSVYNPWFNPSYTKGGWTSIGISSSIGQTPLSGYETTNMKLAKLSDVLSGMVEFLIFPSQTQTFTVASDFKFYSRTK